MLGEVFTALCGVMGIIGLWGFLKNRRPKSSFRHVTRGPGATNNFLSRTLTDNQPSAHSDNQTSPHSSQQTLALATQVAHAGTVSAGSPGSGDITAPLHLGTTFRRSDNGGWDFGFCYGRQGNPTRQTLEESLKAIENGLCAFMYPTGLSASFAVFFSLLMPGDHIVISSNLYIGFGFLHRLLQQKWDVTVSTIDLGEEPEKWKHDLTKHIVGGGGRVRFIWVETISNPLFKIADIAGLKETILSASAALPQPTAQPLLVVDSTWTTPMLLRPLDLGADIVLHSCTKYIGGHSDLMGGAIILHKSLSSLRETFYNCQQTLGAVMAPFDCYMATRGLRSLHARIERHCNNASQLADFLVSHPRVSKVYYPGLATHPQHQIALQQFQTINGTQMFGGMVGFELKSASHEDALRVVGHTQLFVKSTSLGCSESLIEPEGGPSIFQAHIPASFIRISTGLEDIRDLIADLKAALDADSRIDTLEMERTVVQQMLSSGVDGDEVGMERTVEVPSSGQDAAGGDEVAMKSD